MHIGLEKTGTTSIQATMARNRERLQAHGVLYPRSLGEKSHVKAYAYASESGPDEIKFQCGLGETDTLDEFRQAIRRDLESEISEHPYNIICVSNEHCSSRLRSVSEIQRLKTLLDPFCSSISIVVYLRAQGETLRSSYSTYIKTGGVGPFEYPSDTLIEDRYDYEPVIDRWANEFGSKNMDIRLFDNEWLIGGDVVTDFINRLTLDTPTSAFELDSEKNISLGHLSIQFLRSMNKYIPYKVGDQMNPIRGNLHDLVEQFGDDSPFEGDKEIMAALDQAMSDSNERIRRRYFPERRPPLLKPTLPLPPVIKPPLEPIPEAGIRLMAKLWEAKQQQVLQLRQRVERARHGDNPRPIGPNIRPGPR